MEKLANQGNLSARCYVVGSLLWIKWETLGVGFNVNCFWFLEQKWLNCSGVPVPMCFCGDPCKVAKSDEDDTYRQRYWTCSNFVFKSTLRQRRINKMVMN